MSDEINHPTHYNLGKIECIDVIEDWNLGFNLGNAVKYIARANYKGQAIKDLKKAAWYLQREIENRERLLRNSPKAKKENATEPWTVEESLDACSYKLSHRQTNGGDVKYSWVNNEGYYLSPEFNTQEEADKYRLTHALITQKEREEILNPEP